RGLRVLSLAAVEAAKGAQPTADARQLGSALGAHAVVEGSLRRAGSALRASLRLIGVTDGYQLWAQRFDGPAEGLLAIGDAASQAIAAALVEQSTALPPGRVGPSDAEALD